MILKYLRNLILITSLIITSFVSQMPVYAQEAVQPQMLNLSLNVTDTTDYTIDGTVALNNNSTRSYDNMPIVVKLVSPGRSVNTNSVTTVNPGMVLDYVKTGPVSILPGQTQNQNFELKYPAAIQSGSYQLIAEAFDADSSSQGITSQQISILGTGKFLEINPSTCKISVGGETFDYFEGPNINSSGAVASCSVVNPGTGTIEGRPNLVYGVDSVSENAGNLNRISSPELISFAQGQTKTVSINIPTNTEPQVYEGFFQITDNSGQKVSVNIPFRWIIPGPTATIRNLDLDKTYYKNGDTARVSVLVLPSPDLSWRGNPNTQEPLLNPNAGTILSNAKVSLKITDKFNNVCGEKTEALPVSTNEGSWKPMTVDIPINRVCQDPKVEVNVRGEGIETPFATLIKNYTTTEQDMREANPPLLQSTGIPVWAWILGAIILIAGGVFWYLKKKGKWPPTLPKDGPSSSAPPSQPPSTTAVAVFLIVVVSGLVLANIKPSGIENNITVYAATEVPPVNNTDVNYINIGYDDNNHGDQNLITNWGNVRDFSQNGGGGDSQVSVNPECTKIDITLNGTAASHKACDNWAPAMVAQTFIDGQSVSPANLSSNVGDSIVYPARYGSNSFFVYKISSGQRSASFSLTPSLAKNQSHRLTVKVAAGVFWGHPLEFFHSTFDEDTITIGNCGGGRGSCYVLMSYNFTCMEPKACNVSCSNKSECEGNRQGCTECLPDSSGNNVCQPPPPPPPPPACNDPCNNKDGCVGNREGCVECRPNASGKEVCQPPAACNEGCTTQGDCASNKEGCVECRPDTTGKNTCQLPPPACNASCGSDRDCFGNRQGCTLCLEGVCQPPASCNTACTSDRTCLTAKDGCTQCVSGTCRIPPACGTACTTKADCSGARDNCSECLEGTCTDFNDNMCKCDGMVADMVFPSNSFNFEAFGKVEGGDVAKAEIADVTFRMTKDNQVIAKSAPITPTIVESSANKLRVKASWSTPPPPVAKGATYRVFADVRCKPKRITTLSENFTPVPKIAEAEPVVTPKPPIALKFAYDFINKLFEGKDWAGKALVGNVMAQLASPSPNAQSNLQLRTLNFVKLLDTDNCRFVMFKYDETLF